MTAVAGEAYHARCSAGNYLLSYHLLAPPAPQGKALLRLCLMGERTRVRRTPGLPSVCPGQAGLGGRRVSCPTSFPTNSALWEGRRQHPWQGGPLSW